MKRLSKEQKPTVPFVLSLIAGILTLIGGLTVTYLGRLRFDYMLRMTRGYRYVFASEPGVLSSFVSFIGILGIVFGAVVIVSAVMLITRPKQHQIWGVLILIFSILSLFGGMAGYLLGLILGIVGGTLAIAWKPSTTT